MEPSYKNPPIVQRTFTIRYELDEESFYSRLPVFEREIKDQYPIKDARKNWTLNFKSKDGNPDFSSAKPEVKIIRDFHRNNKKGTRLCSVELDGEHISFRLYRTNGSAHTYQDLRKEIQHGISVFMRTLIPVKVTRLDLDYTNLISRANTPDFVNEDGGIHIGELLTVFNRFPTKYESITPPYDCQIGLELDKENGFHSIIRVSGLQQVIGGGSAIRVDLHARNELPSFEISDSNFLNRLDKLHQHILNLFSDIFTEQAKKAF
jgi:uncharacterized protein (TIGR04255 family)